MDKLELNNWQAVQAEVLRRIHERVWVPGELIPGEEALAKEFGCARATVNRALQSLSDAGLLERRRKAGTRVAEHPVRKATLDIPVIRREIEGMGQVFSLGLLLKDRAELPAAMARELGAAATGEFLHVKSVLMADRAPFVFEDRWINLTTVPDAAEADFDAISANEWLVRHAPYSHGEIAFSAVSASTEVARHLQVKTGAATFVIDRTTWDEARVITRVRQSFHPGYRMQTQL